MTNLSLPSIHYCSVLKPDGRSSYPNKTVGAADWLCGEDCWLSGVALRDLRNPQRFSQPCSLSEPLGSGEPRFVRDLGGLASRAHSRLPGYDGVCHRPARASGIFRDAPAVQYQTDVLLSLAACSRLSLASQFRSIGLSRCGSRCLVMASHVRVLRDGRRHRLCIQSPHYVCTPGPRYRSATSSRTRVTTPRQSDSFQMLGSRSKYSSSSFFPPSPAPNCFSDWINSMRSIHLTIL